MPMASFVLVAARSGRSSRSSRPSTGAGQGVLSPVRMEAYRRQDQEFIDAVLENREPSVTGNDGRAAVAVAEAAYQSAAQGRVIQLPPAQ